MDTDIIKNGSEQELREYKVSTPKSLDELQELIHCLTNRTHDYGTAVYAMSIAAVATFNYMASQVGSSGFQAGCADLDILRRIRKMNNGFIILDYDNLLYPQYIDSEHFPTSDILLEKHKEELAKEASNKLANNDKNDIHPDVWNHWEKLVDNAK